MQQPTRQPLAQRENLVVQPGQDLYSEVLEQQVGGCTPPANKRPIIQTDSVARKAQAGIDALVQETHEKGGQECDLYAALEAAASPLQHRPAVQRKPKSERDYMQVVAGVEALGEDEELNAALQALDVVQQIAATKAGTGATGLSGGTFELTPSQKLASFLKDQLLSRDKARRHALEEAKAAKQALSAKKARLETIESQCRAYKHQAAQTATRAERLESHVTSLESKLATAEHEAQERLQALQRKDAELEAVRRESAAKLESTQQRLAELEVKVHMSGMQNRHSGDEHAPASPLSDVFASPAWKLQRPSRGMTNREDDAVSVADSDDLNLVMEAAAAVEIGARTAAMKAHREAELEGAGQQGVLAARAKHQASEERALRSEVATLERKCERADHMLVKSNHAMRVLHAKLQKERQTVAALQEEKTLLQSQLLAANERPQGLDPEQLASLLQELSQCRTRVENLAEERATLAARLEAAEGQLSATDSEHAEAQAAAEREATERLEEARSHGEALESRVDELVQQLQTAAAAAAQLESTSAALQEAQGRCGQLAAELEAERLFAAERAQELANLSEIAQAFAAELMAAREDAQAERTAHKRAVHENAGLQGRVEALTEALSRLERSDDVLESLAEGQAELQGRLRQAEAAAAGARAAAESARMDLQSQSNYAAELEHTVDVLKSELISAEEHAHSLQAAAGSAAEQLTRLTESHEAMQRELEASAEEAGVARRDAAEMAQRVVNAEAHVAHAERRMYELQSALEAAEAREGALSGDLQEVDSAVQEASKEAASLRARTVELERARDDALARVERLESTVQALHAECEALRRVTANVEDTSQVLVNNMCDMTGLIDAVAALQQQNRLLEEERGAAAMRASRAESERDTTALHLASLERELARERERLSAAEAAHEILQHGHDALRADHAVATRKLEAVEEAHAELRQRHSELQQRELELRAEAASAAGEGHRLRAEAERVSALLVDAQSQCSARQSELQEVQMQKEELTKVELDLREKIAELDKARSLAEGKLVLAKQREIKFKAASEHLRQLQTDLETYLAESEVLRQEKEAAEDRCAELTGRCMVLMDQLSALEEQLAAAGAGQEAQLAERDSVRNELQLAVRHAEHLNAQLAELAPLPDKLAAMETERREATAWFDGMAAQLASKNDELDAVTCELQAYKERSESLKSELEISKERAGAAEKAAANSEEGRMEVAAALATVEKTLAEVNHSLELANREHSDTLAKLQTAEVERDAAAERAANLESDVAQLRGEHAALESALASTKAAHIAVEEALHRRLAELEASSSENSGQAAALDEARRRQIDELQTAVQAGSAACTALAAKVEAARNAQHDAMEECVALQEEVEDLRADLTSTQGKLAAAEAALAETKAAKEELVASSAAHARAAELLEVQCSVLRDQVEFLQAAQIKNADMSDGVQRQLEGAFKEQGSLRERLAHAEQALQQGLKDAESAREEAEVARTKAAAAEAQVAEGQRAVELTAAEARAAHAARSEAERRVLGLEQQLELSEVLKEQGQRDLEVAREAASEARAEAHRAHEAAAEAERRRHAAVAESELAVRDARMRLTSQMAVLDRIEAAVGLTLSKGDASSEALEEVAAQLENIITEHGSIEGEAASSGITGTDVQNYTGPLVGQRTALLCRLGKVQRGVARLAGDKAAQEKEREVWEAEKSILRAVCRLALAVTMDQVGGKDAAPAVAAELDPLIASKAEVVRNLRLEGVWDSLRKLADVASSRRRATEADTQRLEAEVGELALRCASLETMAATERRRGERMDLALRSEAERVNSLIGSVRWASGDIGEVGAETSGASNAAEHLSMCVDALGDALKRLVRRYRTVSRHVSSNGGKFLDSSRKVQMRSYGDQDDGASGSTDEGMIPAHLGPRYGTTSNDHMEGGEEADVPLRTRFGTPVL